MTSSLCSLWVGEGGRVASALNDKVLEVVVDREVGHYYINALTGELAKATAGVASLGWRYRAAAQHRQTP